ncbi:MAG TPA: serine/threonine-protein kinase, partial [Blastocatellia bacterium]|nr:serine/threonine-protein kinase [Blastocatellia bacterium]
MKRCPACETVYAHGGEFCAVDGSVLVAIRTAARGGTDADGGSAEEQVTLYAGSDVPADSLPTVSVGSDGYEFFDDGASGGQRAATEADRNLIGRVIAERYRVEEIIGRGGMGVVYKARHLLLERPVAVKLLLTRLLADEKAAQRFYREAQTMARVEHPNAVAIFDFGVLDDGAAYIVMEHIDGETLRSLLGRVKRLGVDDAVAIANQICGAVEAAHRQGVVHRDLKPENIMFKHGDSGALVKVVDFGLAKLGESSPEDGAPILTSAGELFGTPAYMAPEYYESDAIGAAADVYSIGVIVYEMLAGVAPFRGTIKSVVSGHLFKDAPLLGDDDGVPAGVGKAVARALSKSPDER